MSGAGVSGTSSRYGVLGWPVAHSRSPAMMLAAGLDRYQLLPVPPERFDETVRALAGAGFRGANVTIPHKEAALALADEATPAARAIGAANTLELRADGTIRASNTDAPGLLATIAGRPQATAVVLGAGGSARAVVWALRSVGAEVAVWNRTAARSRQLALELEASSVDDLPEYADLLINCTAVGLHDPSSTFSNLPLTSHDLAAYATVVDLVYRPGGTALIDAARQQGSATVDGLEILVSQGALSFTTWTGREAPVAEMRRAVRDTANGTSHSPDRRP
ncbi:MAG: shikimate dehydrogenase [Solirubrobacteraceae bacterium]|nr:shikimate dehydrogenase [Solirubrobacteraceae bacterium]